MLAKRIIPCFDVNNGRVVKGTKFLNLRDAGDPVELAAIYDIEGADEVVFLDITASHEGRKTIVDLAARTAEQVFIPFTVGGGISEVEDMREILKAGADKIAINSWAVKKPELIAQGAKRFGSQCIVIAIDAKRVPETGRWEVYIHGGRKPTGLDAIEWAQRVAEMGAGEILLTSMDADGTKDGYDNDLNRLVAESVPIPLIASGGAGCLEHLRDAIILGKADAVLASSIFHFGEYTIGQAKSFLKSSGIPVRS